MLHHFVIIIHIYHFSAAAAHETLSELDKRLLLGNGAHTQRPHSAPTGLPSHHCPGLTSAWPQQAEFRPRFPALPSTQMAAHWIFLLFVCQRGCCSLNLNILVSACWQNSSVTLTGWRWLRQQERRACSDLFHSLSGAASGPGLLVPAECFSWGFFVLISIFI